VDNSAVYAFRPVRTFGSGEAPECEFHRRSDLHFNYQEEKEESEQSR